MMRSPQFTWLHSVPLSPEKTGEGRGSTNETVPHVVFIIISPMIFSSLSVQSLPVLLETGFQSRVAAFIDIQQTDRHFKWIQSFRNEREKNQNFRANIEPTTAHGTENVFSKCNQFPVLVNKEHIQKKRLLDRRTRHFYIVHYLHNIFFINMKRGERIESRRSAANCHRNVSLSVRLGC